MRSVHPRPEIITLTLTIKQNIFDLFLLEGLVGNEIIKARRAPPHLPYDKTRRRSLAAGAAGLSVLGFCLETAVAPMFDAGAECVNA
jgi:hypothetical protein